MVGGAVDGDVPYHLFLWEGGRVREEDGVKGGRVGRRREAEGEWEDRGKEGGKGEGGREMWEERERGD